MREAVSLIAFLAIAGIALGAGCGGDDDNLSCTGQDCPLGHKCVRVGVIAANDSTRFTVTLDRVLYSLQQGERQARQRGLLHENTVFQYFPMDDGCTNTLSTYRAVQAYAKKCVHVLFGPTCEYSLGEYPLIFVD